MNKENAYKKSVDLLKQCCTPHGFMGAGIKKNNYWRVWGRDSVIMGMAALLANDKKLIPCFRESLLTLARYQGGHGEIPSNVSAPEKKVSYGKLTGRVDANLWFIIGCVQYYKHTNKRRS